MTRPLYQFFVYGLLVSFLLCNQASSQIKFKDLQAGFEENQRRFQTGSFRMKWRNNAQIGRKWTASTAKHAKALLSEANKLKPNERLSFAMVAGSFQVDPATAAARFEKEKGLFEYFHSPKGSRLKAAWGIKKDWPNPDGEGMIGPSTNVDQYVFSLPAPGDFLAYAITEQGGLGSSFSVYPKAQASSVMFKELYSPVQFEFIEGLNSFLQAADPVYPLNPTDSRLAAKIKVEVKDNIAIVQIDETPKDVVTDDGRFKTGNRVYAEIELEKGCLPRLIKISKVGSLDGKLITAAADTYTHQVVEIENRELKARGFYPGKVSNKTYVLLSSPEETVAAVKKGGLFEYMLRGVSIPKNDSNQLVVEREGSMEVVACEEWTPKDAPSFYSLEAPEGCDRINDRRKGEFKINKSIEHSLAIDLANAPDVEPQKESNPWLRRSFWAGVSLICFFVLYRSTPNTK